MKKLLIVASCLALSGCYSLKFNSEQLDDGSVYFTQVAGSHEEHFSESESVGYLLGGLIPLGNPNPAKAFGKYIGSGRKIANLKITAQESFVDGLISTLTLGIYAPLTIRYEGDVVKPRPVTRKVGNVGRPEGTAGTSNNNNNNIVINNASATSASVPGVPVILALTATPTTVRPGQRTAMTVNAMSPGGKALRFNWSSTGGVLSTTSGNVTFWTAPEQPGNYSVVVSVADDAGGVTAGAANVVVGN